MTRAPSHGAHREGGSWITLREIALRPFAGFLAAWRWLRGEMPPLPVVDLPPPWPAAEPAPVVPAPEVAPVAEPAVESGKTDVQFWHIGDVLERVADYMLWLRKFRQHDPDWFDSVSKIGGIIQPETGIAYIRRERLTGAPETWPAFITISFPAKSDDPKVISAKLMAFRKMQRLKAFIPRGQVFYEAVMFYAQRGKGRSVPIRFFVGCLPDGTVVPLYVPTTRRQRLPRSGTITHRLVGYPEALTDWVKDRNERNGTAVTVERHIEEIFHYAANETIAAEDGVQVNIAKAGLVGRFGVPIERTAYFFKDRDFQAASDGRRKRIFHAVAEHERDLGDRRVTVTPHFRGQRHFRWNGYEVAVTVPKHHHRPLSGFSAPSRMVDSLDEMGENELTAGGAGEIIKQEVWSRRVVRGRRRDLP